MQVSVWLAITPTGEVTAHLAAGSTSKVTWISLDGAACRLDHPTRLTESSPSPPGSRLAGPPFRSLGRVLELQEVLSGEPLQGSTYVCRCDVEELPA